MNHCPPKKNNGKGNTKSMTYGHVSLITKHRLKFAYIIDLVGRLIFNKLENSLLSSSCVWILL
jgi:hypothetical protein